MRFDAVADAGEFGDANGHRSKRPSSERTGILPPRGSFFKVPTRIFEKYRVINNLLTA
jgi:hypothetical protein